MGWVERVNLDRKKVYRLTKEGEWVSRFLVESYLYFSEQIYAYLKTRDKLLFI